MNIGLSVVFLASLLFFIYFFTFLFVLLLIVKNVGKINFCSEIRQQYNNMGSTWKL